MRGESLQSAGQWIEGTLDPRLISRITNLSMLADWLKNELPSPLSQECQLINLRGSTLVIGAGSPAWAARLRFQTPRLLEVMSRDLPFEVRKIQVKVLSARPASTSSTKRAVRVSPDTAELLRQTARSLNHPVLSAALARLAAHAAQT